MRGIICLRRHGYLKTITVFLIAVSLIAGVVGCVPPPGGPYELTIRSTTGGNVTAPGEAAFTYPAGTVVNLVAEAEEGYQFYEWTANWAGSVDTVDDVNAATTTITMNYQYYITANFGWLNITFTQVAAGGYHTVGI